MNPTPLLNPTPLFKIGDRVVSTAFPSQGILAVSEVRLVNYTRYHDPTLGPWYRVTAVTPNGGQIFGHERHFEPVAKEAVS